MSYTPEQLSDLEAIRQCALRYCRGVDRLNPQIMKSAYWPDATDNHGSFVGNAWEFVDHCMTSHLKWRGTAHCVLNHTIELDDAEHARGEIYNVSYLFHHPTEDEPNRTDTWHGRYLDHYEKRSTEQGFEWRISKRICLHEATHTHTTPAMAIPANLFRQGEEDRGPDRWRELGD